MPNQIKSATVESNPTRSKASARAIVTYEKDGADTLFIHPSEGFSVTPESVLLTQLDRQAFGIVFERSPQTATSACRVSWTLGDAQYTSIVEVFPAAPHFEVTAESRSLRDGGSVTLKLRHLPGASRRLKVRNTPSFEAILQTNQMEQRVGASPLVESEVVLVIRRRAHTKGSYAVVDLELDGELRSLTFKMEKP
ncbi:hypothetical protein D7X30_29100 [Corallococcus sp. AB011P]|uniref:hypothetical protein n=1 Tax=Corallococcus sp. AB011P TaxID=2316735 RepID=UPI000EA33F2A|nr:hypothetical protein [Corallococcus sp. AB011P]RKG54050.1 hypothetical protein D7X30_29100 [Corallococcus sp. AB011P]